MIRRRVTTASESLPSDLATAHAMLVAERAARVQAEAAAAASEAQAEAANAVAGSVESRGVDRASEARDREAAGAPSTARARSARRGCSTSSSCSSRSSRPPRPRTSSPPSGGGTGEDAGAAFERRRPVAQALPRASAARAGGDRSADGCRCCGSAGSSKLGEDVTETLEVIPRQWKVIQTVREKFACRDCERITQPPAPFHADAARLGRPEPAGDDPVREVRPAPAAEPPGRALRPRGRRSQPLDARRPGRRRRRGLAPLHALIEAHVMAAERLHGDDTTVPLLAHGKTATARLWVYVRDDRPFAGRAPPAAVYSASPATGGASIRRRIWRGGTASCRPTPTAASGSSTPRPQARADHRGAVLGACPTQVLRARRHRRERPPRQGRPRRSRRSRSRRCGASTRSSTSSAPSTAPMPLTVSPSGRTERGPLVAELERWMRAERERLSRHAPVAKAMNYMLSRWPTFTRFLGTGASA